MRENFTQARQYGHINMRANHRYKQLIPIKQPFKSTLPKCSHCITRDATNINCLFTGELHFERKNLRQAIVGVIQRQQITKQRGAANLMRYIRSCTREALHEIASGFLFCKKQNKKKNGYNKIYLCHLHHKRFCSTNFTCTLKVGSQCMQKITDSREYDSKSISYVNRATGCVGTQP